MEYSLGLTTYQASTNLRVKEIILSIFSDHNSMELEINHRKRNEEKTITWRLNKMLLKNHWVGEGRDGLGSRCKLSHLEWVNSKALLYSIGKYIQSPGINHNGK